MSKALLAGFAALILGFALPAQAGLVKRYEVEVPLEPVVLDAGVPGVLIANVDIWEGDNEHILIGAGFTIATVSKGMSGSEQRWNRRKMISDAVVRFQRLGASEYYIELNDAHDPKLAFSVLLEGNKSFDIEFKQFGIQLRAEPKIVILGEEQFSPINGQPVAVEDGNRPVNFFEFFGNKQVNFQKIMPRSTPPLAVKPQPPVPSSLPEVGSPAYNKLSKKQRKKVKAAWKKILQDEDLRQAELFSDEYYYGGLSSWLTRTPPGVSKGYKPFKPFQPSPPPPPKEVQLEGFDEQIKALEDMDGKPTLQDMIGLMRAVKAARPDYDLSKNPFEPWMWPNRIQSAMEKMEQVYERLESAFPGAVWYLLGRDVYLLNDALEAVYLSKGQTGRVRRLPASAPSFNDVDLETIDGFLKTNGLDVDKISAESQPHIILDISSYSNSDFRLSQSRHLMRAAYKRWIDLGRDPRDLVEKVNFVNVSEAHGHFEFKTGEEARRFLHQVEFKPEPDKILSVITPSTFLYTSAWHGLYRKFVRNDDGSVTTGHDSASSRETKMGMLGELWSVVAYYGEDLLNADLCETKLKRKKKD